MYLNSAQIICTQNDCDNCSINVYNSTEEKSHFNISMEFKKKLIKLKLVFTLRSKDVKSKNYETTIWSTNLDLCSVEKGVIGSFLTKVLVEQFHKYSNFDIKCPYLQGVYYVKGFPIGAMMDNFPRSIVRMTDGYEHKWQIVSVGMGRSEKSTPLREVFRFRFEGSLMY